jgi:DNA-directed RNA polymerase
MCDQLISELASMKLKGKDILEGADPMPACQWLSGIIYKSIGEVVIAARNAMDWLQQAARTVSQAGLPVTWTTPAGLPVQQAYYETDMKRIECMVGGMNIKPKFQVTDQASLDKRRQAQGISPNFVHSMDASHLMLSIGKCLDAGVSAFAMVHDSYGTHAADMSTMSRLLREAFVEMYSRDILKKFREDLLDQLPEKLQAKIPAIPSKGNLDLRQVLNSPYFFG